MTGGNAVLPNRPIQDVAISPQNALVGYAAVGGFNENTPTTPGHVFQVTCTTFCGTFTWANKTGNLPNIPVNSIVVNPNVPKQVFAGTDWGLYFTDDITAPAPVWTHFQTGLPQRDDLGHVDRPGRDDARALHALARRLGASAADGVGDPDEALLGRLRDPPQPKPWTTSGGNRLRLERDDVRQPQPDARRGRRIPTGTTAT